MAKKQTPILDALISAEPDFVDRIFEYLLQEFPQLAGEPGLADTKKALREEFNGEVYVPQRSRSERQQQVDSVLALFNGRNATEVGRRLNVSRATVYRWLKQSGGKKRLSFPGK